MLPIQYFNVFNNLTVAHSFTVRYILIPLSFIFRLEVRVFNGSSFLHAKKTRCPLRKLPCHESSGPIGGVPAVWARCSRMLTGLLLCGSRFQQSHVLLELSCHSGNTVTAKPWQRNGKWYQTLQYLYTFIMFSRGVCAQLVNGLSLSLSFYFALAASPIASLTKIHRKLCRSAINRHTIKHLAALSDHNTDLKLFWPLLFCFVVSVLIMFLMSTL